MSEETELADNLTSTTIFVEYSTKESESLSPIVIAIIACVATLVVIIGFCLICCWLCSKRRKKKDTKTPALSEGGRNEHEHKVQTPKHRNIQTIRSTDSAQEPVKSQSVVEVQKSKLSEKKQEPLSESKMSYAPSAVSKGGSKIEETGGSKVDDGPTTSMLANMRMMGLGDPNSEEIRSALNLKSKGSTTSKHSNGLGKKGKSGSSLDISEGKPKIDQEVLLSDTTTSTSDKNLKLSAKTVK